MFPLAGRCTYDERTLPLAQPLLLPAVLSRCRGTAPLLMLLWVTAWYTRGPAAGAGERTPRRRLHEEPGRRPKAVAPRHEERRAHAKVGDHAGRAHWGPSVASKIHRLHISRRLRTQLYMTFRRLAEADSQGRLTSPDIAYTAEPDPADLTDNQQGFCHAILEANAGATTHLLGWVWMVVRVLLLWPLLLLLMTAVHVLLRVPNCQAMRVHLRSQVV